MPTVTGTIHVASSSLGRTLLLTKPNPTPPPSTIEVFSIENPPVWLWEIAVGNAGRSMTVNMDEQTPPAPVAAAVS